MSPGGCQSPPSLISYHYKYLMPELFIPYQIKIQYTRNNLNVPWFFPSQQQLKNPWQLLGFSTQPTWWTAEYGEISYEYTDQIWQDIKQGIIRQGEKQGQQIDISNPWIEYYVYDFKIFQQHIQEGKILNSNESGYDDLTFSFSCVYQSQDIWIHYLEDRSNHLNDWNLMVNTEDQYNHEHQITDLWEENFTQYYNK